MSYLVYMKDRKGRLYPSVWAELPRDGSGQYQTIRSSFLETIELPDEDARLNLNELEEKYPCSIQAIESAIQKSSSKHLSSTTRGTETAEEL